MIAFKTLLRNYFDFLKDEYSFVETTDPRLTIPAWLIRGIAYTNGKIVIIVGDDILEKRFSTIIYEIQPDFKIPIFERYYFGLEEFLHNKGIPLNGMYDDAKGLKNCIEKSIYYLQKYSDEIVLAPLLPRVPRFWP